MASDKFFNHFVLRYSKIDQTVQSCSLNTFLRNIVRKHCIYSLIWEKKLDCLFWQDLELIERILQPERGSKLNGPDKPSRGIFNPPN